MKARAILIIEYTPNPEHYTEEHEVEPVSGLAFADRILEYDANIDGLGVLLEGIGNSKHEFILNIFNEAGECVAARTVQV